MVSFPNRGAKVLKKSEMSKSKFAFSPNQAIFFHNSPNSHIFISSFIIFFGGTINKVCFARLLLWGTKYLFRFDEYE